MTGGATGDEAAWRDLIANFAREPGTEDGKVSWPERENLSAPRPPGPLAGPDTDPAVTVELSDDTDPALDLGEDFGARPGPAWWPGSGPFPGRPPWPGGLPLGWPGSQALPGADAYPGARRPGPVRPGRNPGHEQEAPGPGRPSGGAGPPRSGPARDGRGDSRPPDEDLARIVRPARPGPPDEDDFVPPEPPPLPALSPTTKGAWAALFGGPGYLLVATMAGWVVPGWAAFLAVAAFIAGFAVLVIQLGDRPPRDSGPDDGAVV